MCAGTLQKKIRKKLDSKERKMPRERSSLSNRGERRDQDLKKSAIENSEEENS